MSRDFFDYKQVKAGLKNRRCYMCHEAIKAFEPYAKLTGVCEGVFYSEAVHPECWAEYASWDIDDQECFWPGEMIRPKKEATHDRRTEEA